MSKGIHHSFLVDTAFVLVLGTLPFWMFAPHSLYFTYGDLWFPLVFAIFLPLYRGRILRFFVLTLVGFSACCAVFVGCTWGEDSWWPLFLAAFLWGFLRGTTIAIVLFVLWEVLSSRLFERRSSGSAIWWVAVFLVNAVTVLMFIRDVRMLDQASIEVQKRAELLEVVLDVVGSNGAEGSELSSEIAKIKKRAKGIYGVNLQVEEVTHGYGDIVDISAQGSVVSVGFLGIPAGEPCYWMYFMNQAAYFDSPTVDGKATQPSGSGSDQKRLKQELCFSHRKPVTVRFNADVKDLVWMYRALRKGEKTGQMSPNKLLHRTFDPLPIFASAKTVIASNAAELRR